jgi:hypothetical protein
MTPKATTSIPPGNFNDMAVFGLGAVVVCEASVAEDVELELLELELVVDVEDEELDVDVVPLEELLDVLPVEVEDAELPVVDLVAEALREDAVPVVPEMENWGVKLMLFGSLSSIISIV